MLHPGQQLHLHASRGMIVVALQGDALIHSPATSIGEQIARHAIVLQEGQAHVLADSGWITIHARTRAEIACVDATHETASRPVRLLLALFSALRPQRTGSGVLPDS
ncbi:hypothetical protein GCM10027343_11620 [Noviherbaspirillum agri]